MGRVLQCALIAFLAIANVFAVLIVSDALFQTFAASMVKLFFALVDPPISVRSPWVLLLVSMPYFAVLALAFLGFRCFGFG